MSKQEGLPFLPLVPKVKPHRFSMCIYISPIWNTQRFTELGREEKGEGGDRGDLVEKKESPKEERAVKPVISLSCKNGY